MVQEPAEGVNKVARFIIAGPAKHDVTYSVETTSVNGSPALAFYVDGRFDGVMTINIMDGRIAVIYFIRNPHKLSSLDTKVDLSLA